MGELLENDLLTENKKNEIKMIRPVLLLVFSDANCSSKG